MAMFASAGEPFGNRLDVVSRVQAPVHDEGDASDPSLACSKGDGGGGAPCAVNREIGLESQPDDRQASGAHVGAVQRTEKRLVELSPEFPGGYRAL